MAAYKKILVLSDLSEGSEQVAIAGRDLGLVRAAAEVRPDLIVLGSRERHGLAILINFTEDTVLHAAHCDVLAVRLK
jgi:universal stress protein A